MVLSTHASRACSFVEPLGGSTTALPEIDRLAELLRQSCTTLALTGAGISVPPGIPDFRSPGTGLWEKVEPTDVAHIDVFRNDPARFWAFYGDRFATFGSKEPNEAHLVLVKLEQQGLLDGVITQNVDMLHRKARTRELVEVHGSIERAACALVVTHTLVDIEEVRKRVAGEARRRTALRNCPQALKPDAVLFGECLHEPTMQRAHQLCLQADLLPCIGSPPGGRTAAAHSQGWRCARDHRQRTNALRSAR